MRDSAQWLAEGKRVRIVDAAAAKNDGALSPDEFFRFVRASSGKLPHGLKAPTLH